MSSAGPPRSTRGEARTMRVATVGDIHCKKASQGAFQALFGAMAAAADVLALCGDLTDYGLAEEARVLVKELAAARTTPIVAVLGNHDYESGEVDRVKAILDDAGVTVLDGDAHEINGVGFAGAKGLGGGFGERALQPWGEDVIKRFVRETVEEEPHEIFPFLGSSRLEEPLLRYPVTIVLHGHAHHGRPEGRTRGHVPVYTVCLPLLLKMAPGSPPFRLIDLDRVPA